MNVTACSISISAFDVKFFSCTKDVQIWIQNIQKRQKTFNNVQKRQKTSEDVQNFKTNVKCPKRLKRPKRLIVFQATPAAAAAIAECEPRSS